MTKRPEGEDSALLALLQGLDALGYRFVTVTPETHRRVAARAGKAQAGDLRDVFGWSLPFEPGLLPPRLLSALQDAGMAERSGGLWRSLIRVSSVGEHLFIHSAYPTESRDAVFLGPDSYRFAAFLEAELPRLGRVGRLVDLGAGAGVGAIVAAPLVPDARLTLADVNPLALRFARVNARHAGIAVEPVLGEGLDGVAGPIDCIVANPPFIVDPGHRAYRDGGDMRGARLSLDWATAAAHRLEPGGSLLLYTGSAMVGGRDALKTALAELAGRLGGSLRYFEIDPDIFGEQLDQPGYEEVERIAAVGAILRMGQRAGSVR